MEQKFCVMNSVLHWV